MKHLPCTRHCGRPQGYTCGQDREGHRSPRVYSGETDSEQARRPTKKVTSGSSEWQGGNEAKGYVSKVLGGVGLLCLCGQ